MSLPKEGSREIEDGIIVSEAMDWCKSPTEPVPYRIWAKQIQATNLADSVRQTDDRSHVKDSIVLASYGDEPGVGGGVVSGTRGAECTPKTWSETVRAEGRNMVRHDDEWWMNHKNTYGRLTYVKDPAGYPTPSPPTVDPRMQLAFYQAPGTATDAPSPDATARAPTPETEAPGWGDIIWGLGKKIITSPMGKFGPAVGAVLTVMTPTPLNKDEDVRISQMRRRRCRCITGAYKDIVKRCGPECGSTYQAHHIVPDYTLRYGTRDDALAGQKRIPGLPSFQNGPSICLQGQKADAGSEHGLAHEADAQVTALGSGRNSPEGTADMHSITDISVNAANNATNGKCDEEIKSAVAAQPSLDSTILGRTTINPPDDGSEAYDTLKAGTRATLH